MSRSTSPAHETLPPLRQGDRLTRDEFERRYEAMPWLTKAELIEGVVCIPTLAPRSHGRSCVHLCGWLAMYDAATPGVEGGHNCTVRLDPTNEPQPNALLLIDPARGGQATISADDYIESAPEWVGEVAATSASYDLHSKLEAYRRNGVKEYLVWRVLDRAIDWFVLRGEQFEKMSPDADGLLKSTVFPGLWLDPAALVAGDLARVLAVVQQGAASQEHTAFVARLNPTASGS